MKIGEFKFVTALAKVKLYACSIASRYPIIVDLGY